MNMRCGRCKLVLNWVTKQPRSKIREGVIDLPQGPGLGVTVEREAEDLEFTARDVWVRFTIGQCLAFGLPPH